MTYNRLTLSSPEFHELFILLIIFLINVSSYSIVCVMKVEVMWPLNIPLGGTEQKFPVMYITEPLITKGSIFCNHPPLANPLNFSLIEVQVSARIIPNNVHFYSHMFVW